MTLFDSISFASPLSMLVIFPLLGILGLGAYRIRKSGAIPFTGLEHLFSKKSDTGTGRRFKRMLCLISLILGLGIVWANPEFHSSRPFLWGEQRENNKQFVVVFDISPSMNLTTNNLAGDKMRGLSHDEEGTTKYEAARAALQGFMERFKGNRFGLILFSTQPFLARWPTLETNDRFMEVLSDSLRRGSGSQLQGYSGLTNTDLALFLAHDVILKSRADSIKNNIVILIADAWDNMEALVQAVRQLRADDISIYVIGTGIPEDIVKQLSDMFIDDMGFKIFRAESQAEINQAYYHVGNFEESTYDTKKTFTTNLRWLVSAILIFITIIIVWLLDVALHSSQSAAIIVSNRRGRGVPVS